MRQKGVDSTVGEASKSVLGWKHSKNGNGRAIEYPPPLKFKI